MCLRAGTLARHGDPVLIRRETPADVPVIRTVTAAAFARPGQPDGQLPAEAVLVDELRCSPAWFPELSMVAAAAGGEIVGHVVCSRAHVGATPVLGLGPLSVRPDWQRRGVGSALTHAVLGAADALGEPLVALLGDPDYYARFGFELAGRYQIAPPVPRWRPHFQVRILTGYAEAIRGEFRYAEPFDRV